MQVGIGLRGQHYEEIIATKPKIGWFEVHSENYFGAGGKPIYYLEKIRAEYPISLHGVGLSLGSTDELDYHHLSKLKKLIEQFDPILVSEHLCWSSVQGSHLNDLLPLPYTEASLSFIIDRVKKVQDYLGRQMLIENISMYLQYAHSVIPEQEFMREVAQQTGCGILFDVNNLYVNKINHGWNAEAYIAALPSAYVKEIHLAGFTEKNFDDGRILIDTHNQQVNLAVWDLYRQAIIRLGKIPTLIEWDTDIPELSLLLAEAQKADKILEQAHAVS